MPRFFFHLVEDERLSDDEGCELADLLEARVHALKAARSLAGANIKDGWLNLDHCIQVMDRDGLEMFTLRFGDAFTLED